MLVYLHILMGAFALLSGMTALFTRKGSPQHKKSGLIFVITMLAMSSTGAFLAVENGERLNIIAGCLTFYLVATGFLVVHHFNKFDHYYDIALMVFGLIVGVSGVVIGTSLINGGEAKVDGQPVEVLIVFGAIAILASASDLRIIFFGRLNGKQRFIRHIWRMGIAMFLATTSFFLGQSQVIPEEIRTVYFLLAPVLLVLLLTIYWVVRVQIWGLKMRA